MQSERDVPLARVTGNKQVAPVKDTERDMSVRSDCRSSAETYAAVRSATVVREKDSDPVVTNGA